MKLSAYRQLKNQENHHWWFIGMRQIAHNLLKPHIRRQQSILDAGCGTGGNTSFLLSFGFVVGLDLSATALQYASAYNFPLVKADISHLPFKNRSFSLVTSFDVLYHSWVKNVCLTLQEHLRVLKPGGLLLLRLPAYNWLRRGHDTAVMTRRRFTLKSFLPLLPADAILVRATYANMFVLPLIFLRKFSCSTDLKSLPSWLNWLLAKIVILEAKLITHRSLPFGSSLFVLIKKHA